jgi:hypothetical protein
MGSTARGFILRDLTQHAKPELGRVNVNVAKVLPATATGNLFTVTGAIVVTGLVGVVTTVFTATAVHISLGHNGVGGVGSSVNAIAANPASAYASTAVGSVITPPPTLGGVLPAADTSAETISAAGLFSVQNTIITITTDATNTGAITWILSWAPQYPKNQVATVVND